MKRAALVRGLGRCIVELKTRGVSEHTRDLVLWACSNNLAFDAQIEGTRAVYLFDMVRCFPDATPFVSCIGTALRTSFHRADGLFPQSCELLGLLAGEGISAARDALWACHSGILRTVPEADWGIGQEHVEALTRALLPFCAERRLRSQVLVGMERWFGGRAFGVETVRGVAEEAERLLDRSAAGDFRDLLARMADGDGEGADGGVVPNEIAVTPMRGGRRLPAFLIPFLLRRGDHERIARIVDWCRREKDGSKLLELLRLFERDGCGELLPIDFLLKVAESSDLRLAREALWLIGKKRGEVARSVGLRFSRDPRFCGEALGILSRNVRRKDGDLLMQLGRSVRRYGRATRQRIYNAVLGAYQDADPNDISRDVLFLLYEDVFCSHCRCRCVELMRRTGMVPRAILEECRYDSGMELREFAERELNAMEMRKGG